MEQDHTEITQSIGRSQEARSGRIWSSVKLIAVTIVCGGCVAVGAFIGNLYWHNSLIRTIGNGILTHPLQALVGDPMAAFTPDQQFPAGQQDSINVLLLGCDRDYENRRPVALKSPGRSDSMMLARIDFARQSISVLSIPRDAAVRIPGHGIMKINAAHEIGGAELSRETVRDVFGVQADYYAGLNFDTFRKLVDDVGGVDLTVQKRLNYDDNWGNLHVHLKPGFQHLTGYQAEGYVRIRHSDNDFMRQERQHEFLEALRQRVEQPGVWLSLPNALNAVTSSLETNMTQGQILALANFARKLPKESIQLTTLPCNSGPSFVYVKVPESEQVIGRLFFDNNVVAVNINVPDRAEVPGEGNVRRVHYARRHIRRKVRGQSMRPAAQSSEPVLSPPDAAPIDQGSGAGREPGVGQPDAGQDSGGANGATGGNDTNAGNGGSDAGSTG